MTSYTGTVRFVRADPGELFPLVNPHAQVNNPAQRLTFEVYVAELKGYSAIGTDDYTFTVFTAHRSLVICGVFLVDPTGLSVDAVNYNTVTAIAGSTEIASRTTQYGVTALLPWEVPLTETVANRTLSAGEACKVKFAGASSGRPINHNTRAYIVCYWA